MNLNLTFDLTTPALIFPAISLLMLAYTNRFVVLADLIRELYNSHQENPKQQNLDQIKNLNYRMDIIKYMQMSGATSFILAAISMLLSLLSLKTPSMIAFFISLIFLIVSLGFLLKELYVSIDALKIQIDDIEAKSK